MFIKDVNPPEGHNIKHSLRLLRIDNLVQSLEVFIVEVNNLEVGLNTRRCNTLRNDGIISFDTPADQDLSRIGVILFSELDLNETLNPLITTIFFW